MSGEAAAKVLRAQLEQEIPILQLEKKMLKRTKKVTPKGINLTTWNGRMSGRKGECG